MIHVGGDIFWFDKDVGTYSAQVDGQVYGSRAMQYPTVTELEAACGVALTADDRAALQAEFDSIPVDDKPCRISKLSFDERFTDAEWVRITAAAEGNTQIARMLKQRDMVEFICLLLPKTIAGVRQLEAAGLLDAPGRANQILGVTQ
jgi:hypothetical protein